MKEILSSKKNIICVVVLLLVYVLNTYFYNTNGDISVIIKYSKMVWSTLLDGKFFDYYSFAFDNMMPETVPNYNYFIYLFFAICLAPVYLINGIIGSEISLTTEILIVNTVLLFFVILSGVLVYKLSRQIGLNKKKAAEVFFIENTSIVLVFGSIGFVQFDIVYLDIVLFSLLFYYRKKYIVFSLIMSVAIMLKFLPIIIFIPLILLVEKRILHIAKDILLGMSASIVYTLLVRFDEGYGDVMSYERESLSFLSRIFPENIQTSWGFVSLFVILFAIICFVAYDIKLSDENNVKWMIVLPVLSYGSLIITVAWHPQWLVVIAPFMSLAIVLSSNRKSLPWVGALLGISIVGMLNSGLDKQVDNYMINNGMINLFSNKDYDGLTISEVVSSHFEYGGVLCHSFIVASMVYFMFVLVWDFRKKDISIESVNTRKYDLNYIIGIFVSPAFLILYPLGLIVFNCIFG